MRRTVVIRDPEPPGEDALRLIEQERRREWFRDHWTQGVAFNQHCGIEVRRWDDEAVELFLPYAEMLSAHPGIAPWHRYLSAYFLVSHTGQGGGRRL